MNDWYINNPMDSTYITSERSSSRTFGINNPELVTGMDLPRPEVTLDKDYEQYLPNLPHPGNMIAPPDVISYNQDNLPHRYYQFQNEYSNNLNFPVNSSQHDSRSIIQKISLLPQVDSLMSILSNFFYNKILKVIPNKYNHVISPCSLFSVLLYIMVGSTKDTFIELGNLLGISSPDIMPALVAESVKLHKELIHHQAIKIQIRTGYFINADFKSKVTPGYQEFIKKSGDMKLINFSNKSQSLNTINNWIKDISRGTIEQLVNSSDFNSLAQMVLINIIYFKADWKDKFQKSITQINDFSQSTGLKIKIPLMYQKSKQYYFEDSRYKILSMSYVNPNFVMDFILPQNILGESSYGFPVNNLHQFLETYTVHQSRQDVNIYIPKFVQKNKLLLANSLKKLDVKKLFDPYGCQLFNISIPKTNADRLFISQIIQEAYISIDENSTEVSGPTPASIIDSNKLKNEVIFKADRTFQYVIRYVPSNIILFTGIYDGN
jgi:serpin B